MTTTEQEKAQSPHAILEDAGVAFDPSTQYLDLTKEEKRRTTALLLAIQAYQHLIIPTADYLKEVADLARRGDGPKIQPATIDAMVEAAVKFDLFVAGNHKEKAHVDEAVRVRGVVPSEGDEGRGGEERSAGVADRGGRDAGAGEDRQGGADDGDAGDTGRVRGQA